ncbi:Beige/BEACH domain containing protein [Tritrichomonas foetus]|uniref:Beige/BEACH domain containing protein n=1 Tax=Tritrichomonas foetus TaxID=1144522 RepID=A0A1J4JF48_9EUKA|nr:Beige/BEACH domain containing protein [Tritrichomonas foetus]|eukprot:OHS97305.1 Beige/BEACH domain containing protein [Tritrichomonas foetus]
MTVYGKVATQYFEPTNEQIGKFAIRYMSYELAQKITQDPYLLPVITDPNFHHHDLLQFHPAARNCSITTARSNSISFWFNIISVQQQTKIATCPGGSLILEENGYITFASRSVYITPKQWHLCTISTIEKTNKHSILIVCYIDSSKMGELSTNKTMTITFGSTDDCINQACWLMVPFIRQYPSPIDVNEMNKIRESGPQFPSQFRVEAQGGVKLVPYRGILKYMHLFGGPFYIFNLLLETENEEHFMLFLQSAFNLYRLGCYSKVHFFSNVRYVFLRQQQFFTVMIDQMLTHELEDKGKFDWKGFMMTINDNWLLSSPRVQFRIVLKVLKQYGCNLEDLSLFHTAIDTFLFFELDDETMNNILQVLDLYVKASQNLLKKIAMAIISLLFYDDDNPRNELLDERVLEKQRKLLQFLIQDHITFMSVFTCQDAFSIMAIIGDGLCVEFLHFISILCIENNDYFDLTNLKHYVPYLFLHVRNKLLWISLLQLLTRKERSEIEDFLLIDIARHSLLPIMFDLLTVLLPFEIQNYSPDCISFRILHFFYSMIQSQNISLFGLIANIQNICSLGFGERPISQYPFQLSKKVVVNRRASRPRVYKGNVDDYGDRAEHLYNHQVLIDLDPQLFEDMSNYMQYHPVNLDQFFDVNIPKVPDPEDFLTIVDSPIADLVSLIAAKALAEVGNDLSTFKKVVGPLTIFGADVVPKLAIEMHKKVILGLLDERDRISNDTLFFLIDFLTHRVIEGWWANKSTELLLKIIKLVPGFHKSLPKFIIACISQTQSSEGLMKMGNEIIKLSFFSSLISSMPNYTDALIYLFVNSEMIASESSTEFLKLFSSKINSSELAVAIDSHTLLDFLHNTDTEKMAEAYMTIYNELVQSATVNSNIISAERLDNTRKSRNQKIISTVRTIVSHLTYLRRAFRFQFFTRINKSCGMIERSINTLFTIKNLLHHSSEVPTKFCIVPASHPLTVPNKLIPKFFDYEAAYEKSETKVVVPKSRHNVNGCLVPELQGEITGPKCLDGWHLPPRAKVNIYSLFKSRFQAISEPFKCNFLIAPEMIPSVAVQSSNAIHIMLGSKFYNINKSNSNNKGKYYNIYLIDEYALSHFPIIENAMNRIYGDSTLFLGHVILNIPLSIVTLCIPRTFAYKQNAVDVFTAFGCHYTFIMTQSKRKSFVSQFNLISIPNSRRSFRFAQRLYSKSIESVSKMWANQLLSNYDYLLYLNMISGRSFNDFSQYPIFPWIISDYTTESPCIYRDLTKPMGQLDTTRAHHYDSIFSNTSPPYFYGTHYSNPASVLNFLVRIEPFTTYNVVLHGGFEQPDRMFNSLEETWKGASEQNPTDVRELIPELYSLTSLLYNINKINMHDKTDGTSTSSVVLPKWANDDPYLFIYHMRSALEDPAVSKEIQNWIDLIFGYKQRGNAAIEAKNVFHPLTYSDVTLDSDETVSRAQIDAILNFGQCPQQVFKEPHPARSNKPKNTLLNMDTKLYKIKKQIPNAVRIRVYDDELFVGKQFNHFLGSPPASVNVSDSAFVVNNRCLSIEPAFGISSSAQSNDNSYLAVGTNCGMILNYYMSQTHAFVLISKSLLPGEHFKVVSISSHYGLVFAATDDSLYLFDLTTGYLLRKLETSEPIILAEFDEVQDFIILATKSSIIVLSLEFDEIGYASASEFHEITALATCDDVVWCPTPYFATGHADGSILLWEISEVHKISATLLSFLNGKPITALKIYKSSHACLAIDEEGDAITVSIALLMKRILKPSCFEGCAVCKQTLSKSSLEKVISSSSGHSQSNSSANKDGISGNKSGIFSPLSMQQQSQKQQAQHYQQQQLQQQQQQQQIQKQMHMQHHLQHRLSQSNLQPGSLQYSAFQSGLKSSLFPLSKSGSNSNFNTNSSANTNSGTPNNNQGNTGKTFGSSYNPNSSLVNGENLNEELTKSNISPMPGSLSHVLPSDSNLSSSPIQNISSSNFPPIPSSIHQSNSGIAVHFQGVCALCGLPYCKKCAGTDKPNLCRACEQSEDAGMEYGVSRSMSSFGEGESVRTDFGFATGSPIIRKLSNF